MIEADDVAWFGDRAVLVTMADRPSSASMARALSAALPEFVVRQGMRTVLVEAPEPSVSLRDVVLASAQEGAVGSVAREVERRSVDVVVRYDGPDLRPAAEALGLAPDELVVAHSGQAWRVAMMGFAPGFGYLVPDGDWRVDWTALSRRGEPRAQVPAGSVAIAAGMSAVYPARMPGGWHLIGRTDARVFDVTRPSPSLLSPDDVVRFRPESP